MAKRFVTAYEEGTIGSKKSIIVDMLTGINYLRITTTYSDTLTPLLDPYGRPVVSNVQPPMQPVPPMQPMQPVPPQQR